MATVQSPDQAAASYYPPPESQGGWRWLRTPDEVRAIGGMDPDKLHLACEFNAQFAHTSSVAIIRHGWLVAEWLEISALTTTRYDVWSATKSFTGNGVWRALR